MVIALTGVTGNMGHAALIELLKNEKLNDIRVFILKNDPIFKRVSKLLKKNKVCERMQ